MAFSVLLSIYHKENPQYLRESLDSVFNQTLEPDEVVMVEDGPLTDSLYSVLDEFESRYPNFKRVPLPENRGLGRALNRGLKECSHELVARMDTDDICFPDRFEIQVRFMEEHPEVDVCSSWLEEFDGTIDNVFSLKKLPETHEKIARYMRKRNPMNHPAVMFRKEAVSRCGGYQHFMLFEDWHLWIRMYKDGARFANIPRALLHFRSSPDMFRRRGGWQYAKDSARFQWELHELGLISMPQAAIFGLMRGAVYIFPNFLRKFIYFAFLRHRSTKK